MSPQIPSGPRYSEQTQPTESRAQDPGPRAPMSRRSILRSAAGVGVVGVAAVAGAGAVLKLDQPSTLKPVSKPVAMAPMAPGAAAGPIVVYITDPSAGVLDVFAGTGATQIHNPALVKQLMANLKMA